jgi:uncharacterized membrane protein
MDEYPQSPLQPKSNRGQLAHLCNLAILAAMFVFAFVTYDSLPERIPVHFNFAGNADRWADKSLIAWLAMPLTALGLTAALYASALLVAWAKKHPKLLSMPNKEKFLALPPEIQDPIWQQMKNMLYWICVPTNVIMFYTEYAMYSMASGGSQTFNATPLLALIGATTIVVFVLVFNLIRSVKRAVKDSK